MARKFICTSTVCMRYYPSMMIPHRLVQRALFKILHGKIFLVDTPFWIRKLLSIPFWHLLKRVVEEQESNVCNSIYTFISLFIYFSFLGYVCNSSFGFIFTQNDTFQGVVRSQTILCEMIFIVFSSECHSMQFWNADILHFQTQHKHTYLFASKTIGKQWTWIR